MTENNEKPTSDTNWNTYFRASASAGIWFTCFLLSFGLAMYTEGALFTVVFLSLCFGLTVMNVILMFGALLRAQKD
jgi:hypothetical protein